MIEAWLRKLFILLRLATASPEPSGSPSTPTTPSGYSDVPHLLIGVPVKEKAERHDYMANKYGIREELAA